MKIDSTKSEQQIGKEKEIYKNNKSSQISNFSADDSSFVTRANAQKDFAAILKNTPLQKEHKSEEEKSDKDLDKSKLIDIENKSKQAARDKEKVIEEKNDRQTFNDDSDSKEENTLIQAALNNQQKLDVITIPTARTILHIADLERIISTIRSQTVMNGKQITIELKRSILQGLKLKLTIGKDKSVVAELIAASDEVKNQLNAKADELAKLLKYRGVKLVKLELSTSSDTSDEDKKDSEFAGTSGIHNRRKPNSVADEKELSISNNELDSDTSYQI